MRRLIIKVAVICSVILSVVWPTTAFATANPDSAPTITNAYVYRNLVETGDSLYLIYATIPYAAQPATDVTHAYFWSLIDTDGTTVLGSTVGVNFHENGYNENVWSMYFAAADGLTWGTLYTLRLNQNPSEFPVPLSWNFAINATIYYAISDHATNQTTLAARIIAIAEDLQDLWGTSSTNPLIQEMETKTVLTRAGEQLFRGAIYGVQAMAPAAFELSYTALSLADRTWSDNYTTALQNQWAGTWVETAQQGQEALFGTGYDLAGMIFVLVLMIAAVIVNIVLAQDPWAGFIDASLVLVLATRLGGIPLGFMALIGAVCIIYMGMGIWNRIPR